MLGARNGSENDEFAHKGDMKVWMFTILDRAFLVYPDKALETTNKSDILILFEQTLRDVQRMYYDIGTFDMLSSEFKELCRKAWNAKFNYLCVEMTKNKNDRKYRIFNESKNTYTDCISEREAF